MDRETKLRGLMGLCVRARQATFGEDGCLKSIRGGGCAVLLLDSGASKATQDKYRGVRDNAGVQMARRSRPCLGDRLRMQPGSRAWQRPSRRAGWQSRSGRTFPLKEKKSTGNR